MVGTVASRPNPRITMMQSALKTTFAAWWRRPPACLPIQDPAPVERGLRRDWCVGAVANWHRSKREGRELLWNHFEPTKGRNDLAARAITCRSDGAWSAVAEYISNYRMGDERKALLLSLRTRGHLQCPSVEQVLGYLLRNNIPHAVVEPGCYSVLFECGGETRPGVAITNCAGRLGYCMPYRRLKVVRGTPPLAPAALPDPPLDFDVAVAPAVQGLNLDRVGRSILLSHQRFGDNQLDIVLKAHACLVKSLHTIRLRQHRADRLFSRYVRTLEREKRAFGEKLALLQEESCARAVLTAEALVFPVVPSVVLPDFDLAVGRACPPVGAGGLSKCRRWYGYSSSEFCPGVVRSEDSSLDLADYVRVATGGLVGRETHVLRELAEESVTGATIREGDYFYVRHVPALSLEQLCSGARNPRTVVGLRAEIPMADHEVVVRLMPAGLPVRVRGDLYSIYTWKVSAATNWQSAVSLVLNATITGFMYDKPALRWPALGEVVGPTLDYKYRVLYSLLAQHIPAKCAGLLQLARSAEMGLESRSGVEPAVVACSLMSLEDKLEELLPGPAFEVH